MPGYIGYQSEYDLGGFNYLEDSKNAIVRNGLVLYLDAANINSYPGSGTTWTDLSGNGNNGTLTNGPTYSSANRGSIVFDGTNDEVICTNDASVQITVGTISAWINANSGNTGTNGILAKQSAWGLFVTDNTLRAYDWGNSADRNTGITIGNSAWNYVAMTFTETIGTPSNNAIIYLNGAAVLTTTIKHSNHTVTVQVGEANAAQHFGGNIAQASVYNRVLSAGEILQNFNASRGRYGI
jgi:hypothetical protein